MRALSSGDAARYNEGVSSVLQELTSRGQVLDALRPEELSTCDDSFSKTLPIAVVPGAFTKEYPSHDARGQRIIDAATALGVEAHAVPLPSFCSPSEGAGWLAKWLEQCPAEHVLLISLSKGSADVASFLSNPSYTHLQPRIAAWVSVSGLLCGTPICNTINRHPLRRLSVSALLRIRGYRYRDLRELRWHAEELPHWNKLSEVALPILHVQGFPRYQDLSSRLSRKSVHRLLAFGQSDGGGVLLRDTLRYPGWHLPVLGRDHYLTNVPMQPFLRSILSWAQTSSYAAKNL